MTPGPARRAASRGFSLVEVMITIAIIAIMLALAVPSFGAANRTARERSVVQKLTQDFQWARAASGANDASTLNAALSGAPSLTMTINADCSWTTAVNGTADSAHSMTTKQVAAAAPGSTCAAVNGVVLPQTFTFTAQGFVTPSGTFRVTGGSAQKFDLQVLYSGAMFRVNQAAS